MSWWRSLLNLPPKGQHWSDVRRAKASPDDQAEAVEAEWWDHTSAPSPPLTSYHDPYQAEAAAGVMAPPRRPQRPGQESRNGLAKAEATQQAVPWAPEPESSFTTWSRRFLRGLFVVVLLLAAISGVRSWIRPNTTPPPAVSAEASYPKDEARAVASRFALGYFSWDEANPNARAEALRHDLATGLDDTVGWNGRGRQATAAVFPGEVKVDQGGVAAWVDVRVLVVPFRRQDQTFVRGTPVWQRVEVPVARTAQRVVVAGQPTYVADQPAPLPENMPDNGVPDDELTAATLNDAKAFFAAYGESDTKVAAVAAPGSTIRSLDGVVRFKELTDWQVYTGNDDERRATAAVTWSTTGDTTLAQTYTLTLRRTTAAGGAERWQVAAVG